MSALTCPDLEEQAQMFFLDLGQELADVLTCVTHAVASTLKDLEHKRLPGSKAALTLC